MKRVKDGVVYDTQTSTEIFIDGPKDSMAWWGIYQTRHGAFFKVLVGYDGETTTFTPLSDAEAQALLEKHANHLVEEYFGPLPEYGSAEKRLTVRLPASLARRVETAAEGRGLTINGYVMRSLESSLKQPEA